MKRKLIAGVPVEDWLLGYQAADKLGLSRQRVYTILKDRDKRRILFPSIREIEGRLRIHPDDIRKYPKRRRDLDEINKTNNTGRKRNV